MWRSKVGIRRGEGAIFASSALRPGFVIQAQADSVFMHCFRVAPCEDATRVTQTITKRNETISAAAKRHASRSPGPARSGVTVATSTFNLSCCRSSSVNKHLTIPVALIREASLLPRPHVTASRLRAPHQFQSPTHPARLWASRTP